MLELIFRIVSDLCVMSETVAVLRTFLQRVGIRSVRTFWTESYVISTMKRQRHRNKYFIFHILINYEILKSPVCSGTDTDHLMTKRVSICFGNLIYFMCNTHGGRQSSAKPSSQPHETVIQGTIAISTALSMFAFMALFLY